jgi:hypothetical protein
MSDLLPCPFCGGEAELYLTGGDKGDIAYVQCEDCHSKTPCFTHDGTTPEFFPEGQYVHECKLVWNTRADNTVIKELAEALEQTRRHKGDYIDQALTKYANRIEKAKEQG